MAVPSGVYAFDFASVSYTGDGTTREFEITFPYLRSEHVVVYVNEVRTSFEFTDSTHVQLAVAPAAAAAVIVRRDTEPHTPLVTWRGSANLKPREKNLNNHQRLYLLQELGGALKGIQDRVTISGNHLSECCPTFISLGAASYTASAAATFDVPVLRTGYLNVASRVDYTIHFDPVPVTGSYIGNTWASYPTYTFQPCDMQMMFRDLTAEASASQPSVVSGLDVPWQQWAPDGSGMVDSGTDHITIDVSDYDPPAGFPPSLADECGVKIKGWVQNYPQPVAMTYKTWSHGGAFGIPDGFKAAWSGLTEGAAISGSGMTNGDSIGAWYYLGNVYVWRCGAGIANRDYNTVYLYPAFDTAPTTSRSFGTYVLSVLSSELNGGTLYVFYETTGVHRTFTVAEINPADLSTIKSWSVVDVLPTDSRLGASVAWDPECGIQRLLVASGDQSGSARWRYVFGLNDDGTTTTIFADFGPEKPTPSAVFADSATGNMKVGTYWFLPGVTCDNADDITGRLHYASGEAEKTITVPISHLDYTVTISNPQTTPQTTLGDITSATVDVS